MNHDESSHFSSNKQPEIEIYFEHREAANPRAASDNSNDSVIDNCERWLKYSPE